MKPEFRCSHCRKAFDTREGWGVTVFWPVQEAKEPPKLPYGFPALSCSSPICVNKVLGLKPVVPTLRLVSG